MQEDLRDDLYSMRERLIFAEEELDAADKSPYFDLQHFIAKKVAHAEVEGLYTNAKAALFTPYPYDKNIYENATEFRDIWRKVFELHDKDLNPDQVHTATSYLCLLAKMHQAYRMMTQAEKILREDQADPKAASGKFSYTQKVRLRAETRIAWEKIFRATYEAYPHKITSITLPKIDHSTAP